MEKEEFSFTDEEFIKTINYICEKELPATNTYIPVSSMEEPLFLDRLDSLGVMMFFVWLSDLFGIDEEATTTFATDEVITGNMLKEFIITHHTKNYSYALLEDYIEKCT